MAKFRHIQNDFTAGELSPRAWGRTNSDVQASGLKEATNITIKSSGGADRRQGTQFLKKDFGVKPVGFPGSPNVPLSETSRLIPCANGKILIVHLNTTPNFLTGNPELALTFYDPGTNAFGAASVSTELGLGYYYSAFSTTQFSAFTTAQQLKELQFAQAGDYIIIVHGDRWNLIVNTETHEIFDFETLPLVFSRPLAAYGGTDVGVSGKVSPSSPPTNAEGWKRYIFKTPNVNTTNTIATSATTGTVTVTIVGDWNDDFPAVSQLVKKTNAATTGVIYMTNASKFGPYTGSVKKTLGATTATADWEISVPMKFDTVAFFEQRVFVTVGQNVYATQLGDISEWMSLRSADDAQFDSLTNDRPFSFIPASNERIQPKWLIPGETLLMSSKFREFRIFGGDPGLAIGPLNIKVQPTTSYGSEYLMPIRIANTTVFVQSGGKILREFYFNEAEDSFRALNLNEFADHIADKGLDEFEDITDVKFKEIHSQVYPDEIIFALDDSGLLHSLTRSRQSNIRAWSTHKLGGNLDGEAPKIFSMCVIRGSSYDTVYMMVKRTIAGSNVVYLEKMDIPFKKYSETDDLNDKMCYMDSAVLSQVASYPAGTPATVFTGLDHLEGETVSIIADQLYIGEKVVSGGSVTLDEAAQEVVAGLSYRSVLSLLDPEDGSSIGSSQGAIKRIDQAMLRIYKSYGVKIGRSVDDLEELDLRPDDQELNDPPVLFTGDKTIDFDGDYDREFSFVIVQDIPYPMNISSVSLRGVVGD